ncbi:hypothetical protein [Rhizobium hidalgonense]|uniref:NACHT domain-containing protein n=1 Tax=Rhizobium hidalgonense TaxID=1538159 RepID=A0ABX4JMP4_9HYPH|nr:hypothetical protein [Rhizobium hidalgonense]PDT20052.1 hypothetical protein CO674_29835 [Rhizobium hidalgonense]PON05930.1 hypothetical protein ATY29_19265 [Rhizobium hidalgonense]
MRWQEVEDQVRRIAEMHWNAPCRAEDIHGVRCDGVIRVSTDEMVVIEITKEQNLTKLRTDVSKLSSIRLANFANQIFTKCYFITEHETTSLKATGAAQHVVVMSIDEFSEHFIGTRQYAFIRSSREFGSAVDPETGSPDPSGYTAINYIAPSNSATYDVEGVAQLVSSGRKVVLLGEFGSGKSRCIKEVFAHLVTASPFTPTLAINLRENWGLQTFDLIIRNHLRSLGLSQYADNLVKLAGAGRVRLLLDGFDEIGSQSWTGEAARLREIRKKSLVGVRDLIQRCTKAGVLITGREHYFSSEDEMFDCLNLRDATILECPEEFSEEELREYVASNTKLGSVPDWMPRKPLICQLFTRLEDKALEEVIEGANGEVSFFEHFLDAVCAREKRIHTSIDKQILKDVLLNLAERTREKAGDEELSPHEINEAFFEVSGHTPLDESAIILQRLPYLGRVGSGNPNRVFIDDYAKSGLKGISLLQAIFSGDKSLQKKRWEKSVGAFGAKIVGTKISNWSDARKFARQCEIHGNSQVSADLVCSELSRDEERHDFSGVTISNAFLDTLDLAGKTVDGLILVDSFIRALDLEDSNLRNCKFAECDFDQVSGVASKEAMPPSFEKTCVFGRFLDLENSARISKLPLSDQHKTLLVIIQKLFFQRGRGRKEDALLRGSSGFWDKAAADKILQYMKKYGIVIEAPGRNGILYIPQLSHRGRMKRIKEGMSTSHDDLWDLVS